MKIGILSVELLLNNSSSLKEKRRVLKRLKDRLRNNFNVSVSEVGGTDKWQKAVIGIAAVSTSRKHLSGCLDSIMNFIEKEKEIMVLGHATEIL